MKFISKLYFNVIKKVGNLRLMFVISCVCAGISLFYVTEGVLDNVYYYNVRSDMMPWEYATLKSKKLNTANDLGTFYKMQAIQACKNGDIRRAESLYFGKDQGEQRCKEWNTQSHKVVKATLYSFSYLWNLLWVAFWFYLPFIIVLPLKFIIDGYKEK